MEYDRDVVDGKSGTLISVKNVEMTLLHRVLPASYGTDIGTGHCFSNYEFVWFQLQCDVSM